MKRIKQTIISMLLVTSVAASVLLTGCSSKIEPGDYSGSVRIEHAMELDSRDGTTETIDNWGCDVVINVDENGLIWDVEVTEPEDATVYTNAMGWTISGGKFLGSMSGTCTIDQIMDIEIDTESDGFPVLNGDCSGIHTKNADITLLNDYEVSCALILIAMQDAISENGLL